MGSFKLSLPLIYFLTLAMIHSTHAQNSQQHYLNAHNAARAQVSVGNMVWNATIAAYAQNYANLRIGDCNLIQSGGPYGENLAKGSATFTGTAAVNLWVAEKTYYDYTTSTCASGHACEHYTQSCGVIRINLGVLGFSALIVGGSLLSSWKSQWFSGQSPY